MKHLNDWISRSCALAVLVLGALTCQGADTAPSAQAPRVNYILRVDWRSEKGGTNFLQLITTEGTFKLNGTQPSAVKVGDSELPVSTQIDGNLKALNSEQGQVQFFLGRTVPYETHSGGAPGSSSIRVASAIVCDGVSAAAVVFAPEYGNEDDHQIRSHICSRDCAGSTGPDRLAPEA